MAQGRKTGGRQKGTPNKATVERRLLAAEVAARRTDMAAKHGRKLGVDKMEEYGDIFEGAAAYFRPTTQSEIAAGRPRNPNGDWNEFGIWMDRAFEARKEVTKYQTPKLNAVAVALAPPVQTEERKRFTLTVFEGGKPLPKPGEVA